MRIKSPGRVKAATAAPAPRNEALMLVCAALVLALATVLARIVLVW